MTPARRNRLRRLLYLFALIVIIALTTLGAAALVDSGLDGIDSGRIRERVQQAKAAAGGIAAWLATGKSQAELAASSLEPWTGSSSQAAAARAALDRMAESISIFDDGVMVLNEQSRVVSTTTAKSSLIQLTRDSPHATSALGGVTSASGVVEDPLEHVPVVAFAVPLKDLQGKVTGALVATSRVDGAVLLVIEPYRSDPGRSAEEPSAKEPSSDQIGGRVLVVAPDGTVLAPDAAEPLQRGLVDAQAPARQARADPNPGFYEYQGASGVEKVGGYARASDDWVVVIMQDASDFFAHGTGFFGRLTRATPTRTAALLISLTLSAAAAIMAALMGRLRRAQARAEEAKRGFLAIAGHELRTPLTSIRGFSQMLTARWDAIPEENRKELIQTIARQTRNLEHLIERLIVGAQLEAGLAPSPALKSVDVASAIEQAVDHYRAMSKIHSFEIHAERPLMAEADPKMLQEVLGHLLENAIKYSPAGGPVRVTGRREGGRVQIAVEDEGVGLPSDLEAIFDKFVQGEPVDTRTHDEGGVGLGLFIVKTYLERMNGKVRAKRLQPGARMEVTLKASPKR